MYPAGQIEGRGASRVTLHAILRCCAIGLGIPRSLGFVFVGMRRRSRQPPCKGYLREYVYVRSYGQLLQDHSLPSPAAQHPYSIARHIFHPPHMLTTATRGTQERGKKGGEHRVFHSISVQPIDRASPQERSICPAGLTADDHQSTSKVAQTVVLLRAKRSFAWSGPFRLPSTHCPPRLKTTWQKIGGLICLT